MCYHLQLQIGTADCLVRRRIGLPLKERQQSPQLSKRSGDDARRRQNVARSIQTSVDKYLFSEKTPVWLGGNSRRSLEKSLNHYRFIAEDYENNISPLSPRIRADEKTDVKTRLGWMKPGTTGISW